MINDESIRKSIAPNWTELPPLQLKGVGTPLVESISSYLRRLNYATGLSMRRLGRFVGAQTGGLTGHQSLSHCSLWAGPASMVRLRLLERLTGVPELRCGTLWAVSDIVSSNLGTLGRPRRRWCPECYEEWDKSSYEPLIWAIDLLGHCPKHNCPLQQTCAVCEAHQKGEPEIERRLICWKCGSSLSISLPHRPRAPFLVWVDQQIVQLAEFCGTPRDCALKWSDYVELVLGVSNCVGGERGRLSQALKISLTTAKRHAERKLHRPTLRRIINLCALQGLEMQVFLNAPREASSPRLIDPWFGLNYLPLPSAAQARRTYAACRFLSDFVQESPPYLPSLKILLRDLHVQQLAVRDACRGVYDSYESRYNSQGKKEQLDRLHCSYLWALRVIAKTSHHVVSAKEIGREVAKVTECNLDEAKAIAKTAFLVYRFWIDGRIESYGEELSLRESLTWVMNQWARYGGDGTRATEADELR